MTGDNNNTDGIGVSNGNYFGLESTVEHSDLVILSAPWEVTVSYNAGTADGPRAIIEASTQVELRDSHYPRGWQRGIATLPPDEWIAPASEHLRTTAEEVIAHLESGGDQQYPCITPQIEQINRAGSQLNDIIRRQASELLAQGKLVALVGGDHSTPLGLIQAVAQHVGPMGILHIDAHADLRVAYEGFEYSHASIMHNALQISQIEKLVQVAIRDLCDTEADRAEHDPLIEQFTDEILAHGAFTGRTWDNQCREIVQHLPHNVYISFDIDGLSPELCPGTGTPVPGGLSFQQAVYLLAQVALSGRRIVGFDLNEVAPTPDDNGWNANVGARILYKLCNLTLLSNPK